MQNFTLQPEKIPLVLAANGVAEATRHLRIEDLELSARSYNCLKSTGVETIGQLIEYSQADLGNLPNFGKKSLDEVVEVLEQRGLFLYDHPVSKHLRDKQIQKIRSN